MKKETKNQLIGIAVIGGIAGTLILLSKKAAGGEPPPVEPPPGELINKTIWLRPNGPGDYNNIDGQWWDSAYYPSPKSDHWNKLRDGATSFTGQPVPDDTTNVRTLSLLQQKDAYRLDIPSFQVGSIINWVRVYGRITTPYGMGGFQPGLRLGTDEIAGDELTMAGGYPVTFYTYPPATLARPGGGSWSASDFKTLQLVIGLRGIELEGVVGMAMCSQTFVEINYSYYL